VVLLAAGLSKQAPAHAEAPSVTPIKVVRVTKVVRPITVKKIVERAPVSGQPVYATPDPARAAPAPVPPRTTEKPAPSTGGTDVGQTAPVQRETTPKPQPQAAPDSVKGCDGDACGSSGPPAAGSAS
jgi:hypothetical protein